MATNSFFAAMFDAAKAAPLDAPKPLAATAEGAGAPTGAPTKKRRKKGPFPHNNKTEKQAETAAGPKYRDRAAERRAGVLDTEYEQIDTSGLTAQETGFLGGDLAHTHLVKGLDMVLLEAELRSSTGGQSGPQQQEENDSEEKIAPLRDSGQARSLADRISKELRLDESGASGGVVLPLVHGALTRTAFVFDSSDVSSSTVPTTVVRGASTGGGMVLKKEFVPMAAALVAEIAHALGRRTHPGPPTQQPEKQPQQPQHQYEQYPKKELPSPDGMDMFADIASKGSAKTAAFNSFAPKASTALDSTTSLFAEPAAVTSLKRKVERFEKDKTNKQKAKELDAEGFRAFVVDDDDDDGDDDAQQALMLSKKSLVEQLEATEVKPDPTQVKPKRKRRKKKTEKQEVRELQQVNEVMEKKFGSGIE